VVKGGWVCLCGFHETSGWEDSFCGLLAAVGLAKAFRLIGNIVAFRDTKNFYTFVGVGVPDSNGPISRACKYLVSGISC